MKAKEYYMKLVTADNLKEQQIQNLRDFLQEFVDMVEKRNIKHPKSLAKTFEEFNRKWVNYVLMANRFYPSRKMSFSGFRDTLKNHAKELYVLIVEGTTK